METFHLSDWLQKPFYVWEYTQRRKLFLIGFIVLFSIGFKIIYQPGYFTLPLGERLPFYLAHIFATFGVLVFMLMALPHFFYGYFNENKRTILREIYWIVLLFILLTITHAVIILIENSVTPIGVSLKESLYVNISIGIFPIAIMLFLAYIRSLEIKLKNLELFNSESIDRSNSVRLIKIPTGKGETELKLTLNDLIYIKSANNYSEVYYRNDEKNKKTLVRIPISEIESNINCDYICRIHRGYIVNFLGITKVMGNANKCSVKLKYVDGNIPVSRTKRAEMLLKLQNLPLKIVA